MKENIKMLNVSLGHYLQRDFKDYKVPCGHNSKRRHRHGRFVWVMSGRMDEWRLWGVERETTFMKKCSEPSMFRFQEPLFSKNFCSLLSYIGWALNYKDNFSSFNFNRWKSKIGFENYMILALYFVYYIAKLNNPLFQALADHVLKCSPPPVFV